MVKRVRFWQKSLCLLFNKWLNYIFVSNLFIFNLYYYYMMRSYKKKVLHVDDVIIIVFDMS